MSTPDVDPDAYSVDRGGRGRGRHQSVLSATVRLPVAAVRAIIDAF